MAYGRYPKRRVRKGKKAKATSTFARPKRSLTNHTDTCVVALHAISALDEGEGFAGMMPLEGLLATDGWTRYSALYERWRPLRMTAKFTCTNGITSIYSMVQNDDANLITDVSTFMKNPTLQIHECHNMRSNSRTMIFSSLPQFKEKLLTKAAAVQNIFSTGIGQGYNSSIKYVAPNVEHHSASQHLQIHQTWLIEFSGTADHIDLTELV
jgi:hypothetical protein